MTRERRSAVRSLRRQVDELKLNAEGWIKLTEAAYQLRLSRESALRRVLRGTLQGRRDAKHGWIVRITSMQKLLERSRA